MTQLLQRETEFMNVYSQVYTRSKMDLPDVHEHKNIHRLGKTFEPGQLVFIEHRDSSKFKIKRFEPELFKVTKMISPVTYRLQAVLNPSIIKNRHRNLLLPYYEKAKTLPPLIEKYQPGQQLLPPTQITQSLETASATA